MPFIQVTSVASVQDISNTIKKISSDFSGNSSIGEDKITVSWQVLNSNHICHEGTVYSSSMADSPLLVDVLVPDFIQNNRAESLLNHLAKAIVDNTQFKAKQLFINLRHARAQMFYDGGQVIQRFG